MLDSPEEIEAVIKTLQEQGGGLRTNLTKTIHRSSYPAIDPTRPELNQEGRTVLITGGGTGIGLSIAKSFTRAGAKTVIIASRNESVLAEAKKEIEQESKDAGKRTHVIAQVLDVTDKVGIEALWSGLKDKAIDVDVLVLNAAKFAVFKPLVELGSDEIWSLFEANVHGPLMMAEAFSKQGSDKHKSLVNVASQAIHMFDKDELIIASYGPGYNLTKNSGALAMQLIASHADPEVMQVVNFHPGVVHTTAWTQAGAPKDTLPFDDVSLSGSAAVWLASPEARFLHGRFIWASWDVDEVMTGEIRKKIDEDANFLKIGVSGLKGANRAW